MPTARYYNPPAAGPLVENTILTSVPAEYVPIALSALEAKKSRVFWKTDDDFSNGLQGVLATQWGLLMDIGAELVEGQNRLYRLLDSALNGTQYAQLGDAISPPIPPTPPASTTAGNALRAHVGRLWTLAENAHTGSTFSEGAGINGGPELPAELSWAARLLAVQGVRDTGWLFPDEPVTLKMLLEAGRINSTQDKNTIRNATTTLSDVVTAGGSIADAIGDFLTAAADAGTDGGVIAVQLATSAALLLQLQRINVALNGNPALAGTPSLLFALRGDELITTDNNVLSTLKRSELALSNTDATVTAGQQLQLIYDRLAELQASIIPPGDSLSLGLRLELLSEQLAALAYIDGQGNAVAGGALAVISNLLECICEGVTGTPTGGVVWPPAPEPPCGSNFPNAVLRATVTFSPPTPPADNYAGAVTSWDVLDSGRGVTWVDTPQAGALMVVAGGSGGRQLCLIIQVPEGIEYPVGGFGLNFNPYVIDGSTPASLPEVQYNNNNGGGTETFYTDDVFTGGPAGYDCQVGAAPGLTVDYPIRIYVFSGSFG